MLEQTFPGGSEMARRMRAFDWARSPLGPVEHWPAPLRTSVSTCLDCAFPMLVWWGPELVILYNDEYRPMLGTKHPAALGQRGAKVWAEIWDVIGPMLSQVMERGIATRSRDLMLHIDRHGYPEEAYFSFSYSPIHDEHGRVGGVFCPVIETTEKVIGERRLRTLRDLAARCKGADREASVYRSAAGVLAANPQDVPFAMIYRVDPDRGTAVLEATCGIEPGGPASPRTIALGDGEDAWSLARVAESGRGAIVTTLAARFDALPTGAWKAEPRTAMVLPVLLPGQERPRAILVAAVSPMRALDEDYHTFFGLVATQIASALADAQALDEERRRAEALAEIDRAKTAFFSNVSHEFRTPLALMLGPLQDLLANDHGLLPPDAADTLRLAHRNTLRLLKLVNTLLDFSRIEAGRMEASYEATDLAAFTAELASVFRSAIERAGLRLVVDCPSLPELVYVDRDMWEKIVLNLLSNALKFTFEGEIEVALRWRDESVDLSVRDTGVGIPAADMPQMFQRFHRVKNSRSRTHEGTGIGLALVQELSRFHGGRIAVESEEGRGTTFTVSIPTGRSHLPADRIRGMRELAATSLDASWFVEEALRWLPAHDEGRAVPEVEALQDLPGASAAAVVDRELRERILVADDNADMRDYLRRLLGRRYDVETVSDGRAALERIRAEPPDLVLSDVMMPGLDGFGLLAAVRADERTRAVPVILLSARAGEESRIEGLRTGADAYLIKPFSARELLAQIASQLELARLRHEAEREIRYRSEQYETLLHRAPLGVYLVDADLRIREVNPIALPAFGDIPGGLIGRNLDEILHKLWETAYADEIVRLFRRTLETGEPYYTPERAEFRIDRGVTEYYEWRLDRITLPDGRYGVVCYFRDISTQVQAREALRDADRRKDQFVATLAHELRNPLAPLANSLALLKQGSGFEGDRMTADAVAIMERQIAQMARLLDDLLDVSRITHDRLELRKARVELASVVQQALETARPWIERAGHEVKIELPRERVWLHADAVRLTQVLGNLLNNACKYTEPGGRIRVSAQREGDEVVVSVEDSGIGIPPETLGSVFELFSQVASASERSQGGLGIGLALVKRLVDMHGGSVEAVSEGLGRGSRFSVRLPIVAGEAAVGTGEPLAEAVAIAGRRILIVDDNRDSAASLARLLETHGCETHTAFDGLEAVEAAERIQPDVVLLDLGMPRLSGYDACRRIRETPWGRGIVIVAMTGWGQIEDRRRSREAGFDHHLVKPVEYADLLGAVASRQ